MKEALENLRTELRKHRGSIKRIAEKTGTTQEWVGRVLAGRVHNERVLLAAIEVLAEMREAELAAKQQKEKYMLAFSDRIMSSLNPS